MNASETEAVQIDPADLIVDASGKTRKTRDTSCPRCGAGKERRTLSAGFGSPHDVCGRCGHDFQERTL